MQKAPQGLAPRRLEPYDAGMGAAKILPLSEMSRAAKLRLMEELWDDLCHSPEGVGSPSWHGEALAARVERVNEGEAEFHEWQDVRERLLFKKT